MNVTFPSREDSASSFKAGHRLLSAPAMPVQAVDEEIPRRNWANAQKRTADNG